MAPGQPNGQQRKPCFKPADMDGLPISEVDKAKYKAGLAGLWHTIDNNQPGTLQHQEAFKKVQDFTTQLVNKIKSGQRPASQASTMGSTQGSQASPNTQAGLNPSVAGSAGTPAAPTMSGGANVQGRQPQQGNRPQAVLPPQIRQHALENITQAPQEIDSQGPEAVQQYLILRRERFGTALLNMQKISAMLKDIENKIRALESKGAALTPDEQKALPELKNRCTAARGAQQQARNAIESFRKEQATIRESKGLGNGAGPDGAANRAVRPGQQPGINANAPQPSSAAEGPKGQPASVAGRMPGTAQAGPQQQQQSTQPPQASPVTAQPVPAQPHIKIEPGMAQTQTQTQVPPPVNTAIASATAAGMQSAGTPTQNTTRMPPTPIQTSTPATGAPHSLSHSAALERANHNNRISHQSGIANPNPLQGTPPQPGGTPLGAGVMGSAAQQPGHSHAHPGQQPPQTTIASKLPIPKNLPEKATMPPQPVSTSNGGVPAGRPTYTSGGGTAGGVMGQPILPKIPQIQMEGEGERVMNRKKLDDLLRQVCGGQAEGQEGNTLTPDVEEVRYPRKRHCANPTCPA